MDDIYSNYNGVNDQPTPDEMSLFLHQILLRSSPSSCSSYNAGHNEASLAPNGAYFSANVSSLCAGGLSENEHDEFDCESEEGVEPTAEEERVRRRPPRSSSKRSRAAEVHNLSEKRRRRRINEKMKSLQNLIPNSNKTDKASMLDEAIEYLKQLQLQVQMLSLRNGVSFHPMCGTALLPPVELSQLKTESQMEISGSFSTPQETSDKIMFNRPNQCSPPNHLPLSKMSCAVNSDGLSGLGSSHFGSYLLHTPSQGIIRENVLSNQDGNAHPHDRKLSEFEMGTTSTNLSFPFKTQGMRRDQNKEVLVQNIGQNLIPFPELKRNQLGKGSLDCI